MIHDSVPDPIDIAIAGDTAWLGRGEDFAEEWRAALAAAAVTAPVTGLLPVA